MEQPQNVSAVVIHGEEKPFVKLSFTLGGEKKEVQVYRKKAEDFVFGIHGKEYFDDVSYQDEEMIFQGTLEAENAFYTYEDKAVEIGTVYMYRVCVAEEGSKKTGPVPVKVRDGRVWWSFDKILREMRAIQEAFPQAEIIQVGETVQHRPLYALICGNRENMIAGVGAIHAGESGPEILLTCLRRIIFENPALLKRTGFAVLPVVNADMREALVRGIPWYIRKNANEVDLNRNFESGWETVDYSYGLSSADPRSATYRGAYPASEPETRAVMAFVEKVHPQFVMAYHALASITGDRMLCAKIGADDEAYMKKMQDWVKTYSDAFRRGTDENPYDEAFGSPECSHGSLSEWLYRKGICGGDWELPCRNSALTGLDPCKKDLSTLEMLNECMEMHLRGLQSIL